MPYTLDINTWERKDHFHFFRKFEEPFFGVTVSIDCTKAYSYAKQRNISFFLCYLYKSLWAANQITPFKYRIQGEEVVIYEQINASPTINRNNGTFGFAYMDYHTDFEKFYQDAQKEIDRVQNSSGLIPATSGENIIHYSSIPWLDFTSFSHARAFSFCDSIPKIVFGKMKEEGKKKMMSVSIHVHHALMDGYHVGLYVDLFQKSMNEFQ